MWSFMPHERAFSMSSLNAFAVVAIIGIAAASSRERFRMAFVASYPSIFGIWTSMRMASYVPGGEEENRATASAPSWADAVSRSQDFQKLFRDLQIQLIVLCDENAFSFQR